MFFIEMGIFSVGREFFPTEWVFSQSVGNFFPIGRNFSQSVREFFPVETGIFSSLSGIFLFIVKEN